MTDKFEWDEKRGVGFYPVKNPVYDAEYWEKYVERSKDDKGHKLNEARVRFVNDHVTKDATVVDIGIGSGQFIEKRGELTYGYDVNPYAISWLLGKRLWWDPHQKGARVVTCWDSLEHMRWPEHFLRRVEYWIFISIPIFKGREHCLKSKHFRVDEHYWYFTNEGLISLMTHHGFELVDQNRMEEEICREDIGTYAFRRPSVKE